MLCTCQDASEARPQHSKSFRGAIVGYAENMPAYRVWDLAAKIVRVVSYNFTIAHEGFYLQRQIQLAS